MNIENKIKILKLTLKYPYNSSITNILLKCKIQLNNSHPVSRMIDASYTVNVNITSNFDSRRAIP